VIRFCDKLETVLLGRIEKKYLLNPHVRLPDTSQILTRLNTKIKGFVNSPNARQFCVETALVVTHNELALITINIGQACLKIE
jgi:hypothetical protein